MVSSGTVIECGSHWAAAIMDQPDLVIVFWNGTESRCDVGRFSDYFITIIVYFLFYLIFNTAFDGRVSG